MTLNSFGFLLYLAILFLALSVLQLLRHNKKAGKMAARGQIVLLFLFSCFFVAKTDWRFCLCVFIVATVSYCSGLAYERYRKKPIIICGILVLLGILGFFKYCNFFIESINIIFKGKLQTLSIILPIGISFYVFSAVSYVIDIYRGKYKAEKNIMDFCLYIIFFPKIIAGPIVRADEFLPQVKQYRGIEKESFLAGIQIFAFGLFKKLVLADHLNVFVDNVFFSPGAYNTGTVILGVVSYSLQIYFDFSGYSDMAIGISKTVGFEFKSNFNLPYVAENVSDFWKRWHISLSSWLRDYIYIPLGGSRKGTGRTYINLMLVMLVSGIWHGAGWTYILWGALYGVLSCLNKAIGKHKNHKQSLKWIDRIVTFVLVTLLWVVFRAKNMENMVAVMTSMFTLHGGISLPYTWSFFAITVLIISIVVAKKKDGKINGFYPIMNLSKFWNQVLFFVFVGLTIIMGYFGNTAFIYGKF